ncbi:hypothetical protein NL676_000604 [Syzygium grande]|nr:hypothetical protein NL676_000604 [Syzygium grande]
MIDAAEKASDRGPLPSRDFIGSGGGDSLTVPVVGVAGGYGGLTTLVEITQDGTMTSMFGDYGSSDEMVRNDKDRRKEMMKQVRLVRWRR